jgi:ABC-2 type transport system permease protein
VNASEKNRQQIRRGGYMRLRGMMRKEILQIIRDPSSIAIAFVLPLILLFLFGYGVSLDAKHVPIAIVVEHPSALTESFTGAFAHSQYFDIQVFPIMRDAEKLIRKGEIDGIVCLRADFGQQVLSGNTASIGVFVNGVDANNARIIEGYVQGVWTEWLVSVAASRGQKLSLPVDVEQRVWFNPALRSRNFLVPGLIAIIMTLIGALLTALVVAREWERGTMEALLVTPIRVRDILLGKIIPYFILGMGGLLLSIAMAIFLFRVPLQGSLWVLMGTSAIFLMAALGMGLLISTMARNQFVAGQVAIITTYLPAFILSGFIFDINSMPWPIQGLTHVIAARYYVAILQSVFAAGDIWPVILPNALALILMAAVFLMLVRRRTQKSLE